MAFSSFVSVYYSVSISLESYSPGYIILIWLLLLLVYTIILFLFFFFFNDTATTEIYTLSLHDALPIHQGRGVGADAEEGGVAEGDLAGVASRHVPGGGERSPHEDQDQAVEDERVAHDQRQEGGDAEERERGPAPGRQRGHHTPSVSAPRAPKSPAGRKTSTAMNRTK